MRRRGVVRWEVIHRVHLFEKEIKIKKSLEFLQTPAVIYMKFIFQTLDLINLIGCFDGQTDKFVNGTLQALDTFDYSHSVYPNICKK